MPLSTTLCGSFPEHTSNLCRFTAMLSTRGRTTRLQLNSVSDAPKHATAALTTAAKVHLKCRFNDSQYTFTAHLSFRNATAFDADSAHALETSRSSHNTTMLSTNSKMIWIVSRLSGQGRLPCGLRLPCLRNGCTRGSCETSSCVESTRVCCGMLEDVQLHCKHCNRAQGSCDAANTVKDCWH
jgi:hypothetical protein